MKRWNRWRRSTRHSWSSLVRGSLARARRFLYWRSSWGRWDWKWGSSPSAWRLEAASPKAVARPISSETSWKPSNTLPKPKMGSRKCWPRSRTSSTALWLDSKPKSPIKWESWKICKPLLKSTESEREMPPVTEFSQIHPRRKMDWPMFKWANICSCRRRWTSWKARSRNITPSKTS